MISALEEYDFDEERLFLFCTHEGGGTGHNENDIKEICSGAKVKKELVIYGGNVKSAKNSIVNWIEK